MATIIKRETKKGPTYKFQVKCKDVGSGKVFVKSTTWKPPSGLSEKQREKEALLASVEFENKVKMMMSSCSGEIGDDKMSFKAFTEIWLEKCKRENSVAYYVNSVATVAKINEHIGGYKLKDMTPRVFQVYFNKLDDMKNITYNITPNTEKIRSAMAKKNITYKDISDKFGNGATARSMNGGQISIEKAEGISKMLGEKVDKLYNVQKEMKPYAYETIHKIKRTVRAIMAVAKKQRLVENNYASAEYIDTPKRIKNEVSCLTDEQVKILATAINDCPNIEQKTAVLTVLLTGVRRGELCGLEWSDIDFEKRTLQIKRSVSVAQTVGRIEKLPKTQSGIRCMSLPIKLINQLEIYKEWQDKMRNQLGDAWEKTNRVFTGEFGRKISPSKPLTWFQKLCKDAGLPKVTLHSLRHTNITLQITAGVPISIVSHRAGHSKISTTTDIYTYYLNSSDRQAADKLDAMFE